MSNRFVYLFDGGLGLFYRVVYINVSGEYVFESVLRNDERLLYWDQGVKRATITYLGALARVVGGPLRPNQINSGDLRCDLRLYRGSVSTLTCNIGLDVISEDSPLYRVTLLIVGVSCSTISFLLYAGRELSGRNSGDGGGGRWYGCACYGDGYAYSGEYTVDAFRTLSLLLYGEVSVLAR